MSASVTVPPTQIWTPGIDVSHYQGVIDWAAVTAAGIKFAYVKATEGSTYTDPLFAYNVAGARAAGLLVGAYHYMQPSVSVQAQAEHFLAVAGTLLDLPPALDVEEPVNADDVLQWLGEIESYIAGPAAALLYCNATYAQLLSTSCPDLAQRDRLWIAEYDVAAPRIAAWNRWKFWQHASGGYIPGITTPVDVDYFNGDFAALQALAASTQTHMS